MPQVVTSRSNPRIKAAAALHRARQRQERGLTLLEGPHLLGAALAARADLRTVFALEGDEAAAGAADAGVEVVWISEEVLQRLASTEHPRGPVAEMAIPAPERVGGLPTVVLWGLGDPGNAGTVIRTAAGFGMGVVTTPGTVDIWSPKVLRAGAGAHFVTVFGHSSDPLRDLRGHTTVAAVARGGVSPASVVAAPPVALLIGEEAGGLSRDVAERADARVTIPMVAGVESLNAAVAAAVLAYELVVRRREAL